MVCQNKIKEIQYCNFSSDCFFYIIKISGWDLVTWDPISSGADCKGWQARWKVILFRQSAVAFCLLKRAGVAFNSYYIVCLLLTYPVVIFVSFFMAILSSDDYISLFVFLGKLLWIFPIFRVVERGNVWTGWGRHPVPGLLRHCLYPLGKHIFINNYQ